MREITCSAVVVAAGTASRMCGIDKALAPIDGVPLLLRTVQALAECASIDEIVVVTRQDLLEQVDALCKGVAKYRKAVLGGSTRTESVMNGLAAAQGEMVAIHDGARPFVTPQIVDATVEKARLCRAAAPAIAVKDTIKVAENGMILQTPERSKLYAVQTPQVFYREEIFEVLNQMRHMPLTDDCSAMEFAGRQVSLTEGSDENIKITTPIDLLFAEAIVKRRNVL